MTPEAARSLLSNPCATSQQLADIAHFLEQETRLQKSKIPRPVLIRLGERLVIHPNLPLSDFLTLALSFPRESLGNPALPLFLLENPGLFVECGERLLDNWSRCLEFKQMIGGPLQSFQVTVTPDDFPHEGPIYIYSYRYGLQKSKWGSLWDTWFSPSMSHVQQGLLKHLQRTRNRYHKDKVPIELSLSEVPLENSE